MTEQEFTNSENQSIISRLREELKQEAHKHRQLYERRVPAGDLLFDRVEIARNYGFGEGSTCYDSALILGDVTVGKSTWIGPNTVLDGSGTLQIGDFVSISAGVQIYTHHTVEWSTSLGEKPIERRPTRIESGVYIGPNSVIQMGVVIGAGSVIGAMSFVNKDVTPGSRIHGCPAR